MDLLFESGLFAELGEVVGCDPILFEDIPKQQTFSTSSYGDSGTYQSTDVDNNMSPSFTNGINQGVDMSGHVELDTLLAEGDILLEQLMTANGLQLSPDCVNLACMDEVSTYPEQAINNYCKEFLQQDHLLSPAAPLGDTGLTFSHLPVPDYPLAVSPSSSISTLPSEPSSPVDLFTLQDPAYDNVSGLESTTDFTDLLQSLIDDTVECNSGVGSEYAVDSPYSSYPAADLSWAEDDSVSVTCSPVPSMTSAKSKRKSKSTPYSKLPAGRKERKKRQNKEAAIRYREKKRVEGQGIVGEEAQLVAKNSELKTEVTNMEREIMCMKELLSDVFNVHSYE